MPLVRAAVGADEENGASIESIDRTTLRADLRNEDVDVRRRAIRIAGRTGSAEMLARHLETESDSGLREMVQTTLIRIGGREAARPLLELLRSEDAALRSAVIETLQSMGDSIASEIECLLSDPDPDVRIFAVNIVHSLNSPRVPDIALKVISTDTHVNVCAAAVDVLAEVGRPDMAAALRDVVGRFPDQPFLSFAVRAALKRIG